MVQRYKSVFGTILLSLLACISPIGGQTLAPLTIDSSLCCANPKNRFFLESSLQLGKLLNHTNKLTLQLPERVWAQELSVGWQMTGRRPWHHWQRYPALGAVFWHTNARAGAHGRMYALMGFLDLIVLRQSRVTLDMRFATGLGYVQNPYDFIRNPTQNAIGSHINSAVQYRLGLSFPLHPQLSARIGGALNHVSNGGTVLPNFGLNFLTGYICVQGTPRPKSLLATTGIPKRGNRHWGFSAHLSGSAAEYGVFDGPKYPFWGVSTALYRQLNRVSRLHAGVQLEYSSGFYRWGLHSNRFPDAHTARRAATKPSVFALQEFLFGDLSMIVQAAAYLGQRSGWSDVGGQKFYTITGLRYYLPTHTSAKVFLGLNLKTHRANAEYIALALGMLCND
jgi:Lipid A 3-O-deacylase (PagL)